MKRMACIMMSLILLLCSCGQPSTTEKEGNNPPIWQEQYDLGIRYLSEGYYEEAIIAFTAAIEIDPKRAEAYVGRGNAYIGLGETEDNLSVAQADYEKALELDSKLIDTYLSLANVHILQKDFVKANEVIECGIKECGSLDELVYLKNKIFRDSKKDYEIILPVDYSVVYQSGDIINVGEILYEVTKNNNQYQNYCVSDINDTRRTIYGSLHINDILWNGGERVYSCYVTDATDEDDILIAAPPNFEDTYFFAQRAVSDFRQYFESNATDGTRRCSLSLGAFGYENGYYQYTLQEILTTSNYLVLAVYDASGLKTGVSVLELKPSQEILKMLKIHTVFETIET